MTKLFISYSRKDIDAVRKLTQAFSAQGMEFWIDWEGIPPTVDWWPEVEKGIEESDIFVFNISPDSINSKVCRQEIEHAVKNGKRLVPLVLRDVQADECPPEISSHNWIFFRPQDDFEQSLKKLTTAIKTDYAWVEAHRQIQMDALEWDRNSREGSFLLRGQELRDAELQLARNSSKEPHPTDLQREYLILSRQAVDRQRRTLMTVALTGAVIMAALAVYGFWQANLAQQQTRIAHLREVAAQSALLRDHRLQTSLLLGVEAFRQLGSNPQTLGLLLDNTRSHPQLDRYLIGHSGAVNSVAFSPDGKTIASGGADKTIIL
ncbi:MAG: toll/interleukin-1 receptor domain-containing protein, partial [Bacteroidota bacterium]